MKIIFYKPLLVGAKNLTPNERIIYSFLVSKTISNFRDSYSKDGTFIEMDELFYYLEDNDNYLNIVDVNNSKISRELHITRMSVINGLKSLKLKHYIDDYSIFVSRDLIGHGYFELLKLDEISGELLIFYSYLKHKSLMFGGSIDTFKYKLAEDMNITKVAVTKLLNRLYRKGLAERMENGRLKIN